MYENHYDFEALFQADRDELERKLELRRKLKIAAERKDKPQQKGRFFLVLQSFRNIFKT